MPPPGAMSQRLTARVSSLTNLEWSVHTAPSSARYNPPITARMLTARDRPESPIEGKLRLMWSQPPARDNGPSLDEAKLHSLPFCGDVPPSFQEFIATCLCDDLLHSLLLYMRAVFQMRRMEVEHERRTVESIAVEAVKGEVERRTQVVAKVYSSVILEWSNLKAPMQDREFFEAIFQLACHVMYQAFPDNQWMDMENELSRIFRGPCFNVVERHNRHANDTFKSAALLHRERQAGRRGARNPTSRVKSNPWQKSPVIDSLMHQEGPVRKYQPKPAAGNEGAKKNRRASSSLSENDIQAEQHALYYLDQAFKIIPDEGDSRNGKGRKSKKGASSKNQRKNGGNGNPLGAYVQKLADELKQRAENDESPDIDYRKAITTFLASLNQQQGADGTDFVGARTFSRRHIRDVMGTKEYCCEGTSSPNHTRGEECSSRGSSAEERPDLPCRRRFKGKDASMSAVARHGARKEKEEEQKKWELARLRPLYVTVFTDKDDKARERMARIRRFQQRSERDLATARHHYLRVNQDDIHRRLGYLPSTETHEPPHSLLDELIEETRPTLPFPDDE